MVKGLISQLTASVMSNPFGFSPTRRRLEKSTPIIIGQTMAQMSTATARFTLAYSKPARAPKTPGRSWPRAIPAAIASATHSDRKRSKAPIFDQAPQQALFGIPVGVWDRRPPSASCPPP